MHKTSNNKKMKISIIVPTYNSQRTIKRCLDSVIGQTFVDWELLIVDGCSRDETLAIVSTYNDSRICIYSEPDKGIYDAMNKGINRSSGEWLYFLGSDDSLYDSKVLEDVEKELSTKYDILYGDVYAPQLSNEYRGEWTISFLDYNRCHQSIFYRRDFFSTYGLYNLKYTLYADYDINLKWILNKNIKSRYINRLIANYSANGASSVGRDEAFWEDFEWNILKRGFKLLNTTQKKEFLQRATNVARIKKIWLRYILLRIIKSSYTKCQN